MSPGDPSAFTCDEAGHAPAPLVTSEANGPSLEGADPTLKAVKKLCAN